MRLKEKNSRSKVENSRLKMDHLRLRIKLHQYQLRERKVLWSTSLVAIVIGIFFVVRGRK